MSFLPPVDRTDAFGNPMAEPSAPQGPAETAPPPRDPGGLGPRLGAALIDGLITNLAFFVLLTAGSAGGDVGGIVGTVLGVAVVVLYAPLLMARAGEQNGRTWGKQAAGLRVVRLDGQALTFGTGAMREVVGKSILGLFVLPTLASIVMVFVRPDKRTVHDFVAGTQVVRG